MSYIAYLNFQKIELLNDGKEIAFTKQVNSLSRLDNRQSNFTHKFIAPLTDNNKLVMDNCFIVGNQSNIPYQKNRFDLIDADSGKHLIFDGWANITQTSNKGYEINTYDGIIDFYKEIENKSLTEIGIADLNHVKNIENIVDSWNDTFAYKYILADYNGKKYTDLSQLNADYLIPSARISYIWDRIHTYAGMTYTGSVFESEKFLNLYMTFPKPIPTTDPITILITSQNNGYLTDVNFNVILNLLPTPFTTIYANGNGSNNQINITQNGSYRLSLSGYGIIDYLVINADGSFETNGTINGNVNGFIVLNLTQNQRILLNGGFNNFGVTLLTTFELIDGYNVNFDEAFVDFSAKDFIKDIVQHFALTSFKDPYSDSIEYLTLDEILQNTDVIDWSDKFSQRQSESYILSGYAQKNNFTYRYNEDNVKHNDGFILVENENLKEETNVVNSKFYSPEQIKDLLIGREVNVYKFWNKELTDDLSVKYKDLQGRYYLLRSENVNFATDQTIASELLGISDTFTSAPFESYYRLSMQGIIFDNYKSIGSILNKAKMQIVDFYLSPSDYESFDFKKLIYVKQLGSYYLVNKISNFIKNKLTKCELIEVDYFTELVVPEPIDYVLQINNDIPIDYTDCEATFTLISDIPIGSDIEIVPYCLTPDGLGGTYFAPYPLVTPITATYTGATLTYDFSQLPFMIGGYKFKITYRTSIFEIVESNFSEIVNIDGACYFPIAPTPNLSFITITNVVTTSVVGNRRNVRVSYISDLSVTTMTLTLNANGVTLFASLNSLAETFFSAPQNSFVDINLLDNALGEVCQYQINLSALGITSNIAVSQ